MNKTHLDDLCDFAKTSKEWICRRCGRRASVQHDKDYMPTARCRVPAFYKIHSQYIGNQKILGVGDVLGNMFTKIGYKYPIVGREQAKATYLNNKGVEWCENHQPLILKWIEQECKIRKINYLELVCKSMLRLAIRKVKNQIVN